MIPLHKLSKLPRSQRLRKAANLVRNAERRFVLRGRLEAGEAEYFGRLLELLAGDEGFPPLAAQALKSARAIIAADAAAPSTAAVLSAEGKEIRRALNTVYQILLEETGRFQADWDFYEPDGTLDAAKRKPFAGMQVYLEDIRSPFNVGSMFRAAESFGAEKIWLSPLCADPRHKRAQRSAMGCMDILPWERFTRDPFAPEAEISDLSLPFSECPLFTLETGGVPLADFPFPPRGIMIAGSEELGVSPRALAAADASLGRVSIPSYGAKGSLNVSVAFGIVMQAWAAHLIKN